MTYRTFGAGLAALLVSVTAAGQQVPDAASSGHEGHAHEAGPAMASQFGPYSMTREGSGTSWQPEATPLEGSMWHSDPWMVMAHGMVNWVHDHQGGPRGDDKNFSSSMFMVMASRDLGPGTIGLRSMVSLDPTIGRGGYPLLLQTGETADGQTHLVDRQHPHDAFMELSGTYSLALSERSAAYAYAGLPGEPALGPSTFMHRFSGMRNPEAPITHHWLDSTHVTMGVVTLGASQGPWKLEASRFNGREPDQNRWNIETRAFDSSAVRLSFNPSPEWSAQVSHGDLKSPEQLEPGIRVKRTTASVMRQSTLAGGVWGTTLAWGRNDKRGEGTSRKLDGWLLESTLEVSERHTFFGRVERVSNDELFDHDQPLHGRTFDVGKLSLGYIHDFARTGPVKWAVGGLASAFSLPSDLKPVYGGSPHAFMLFLQARL